MTAFLFSDRFQGLVEFFCMGPVPFSLQSTLLVTNTFWMNPWPVGVSRPENAFTGPRAFLGKEKMTPEEGHLGDGVLI